MNKLSEDERIRYIKKRIENLKQGIGIMQLNGITQLNWANDYEYLLDLYQQEKNKELDNENKKLSEEIIENICKGVEEDVLEEYRQQLKNSISKDKIRDMKRYREFELQQQYKDFENDSEWKTYNKILEEE